MRIFACLVLAMTIATPGAAAQKTCGSRTSVQFGETTTTLAQRCGINVEALKQANPGLHIKGAKHGTFVTVPSPSLPSPTVGGSAIVR